MRNQLYLVVNSVKTEVKRNRELAIASAERVAPSCRTIVYEFKPRNQSVVIWDTGRERVSRNG